MNTDGPTKRPNRADIAYLVMDVVVVDMMEGCKADAIKKSKYISWWAQYEWWTVIEGAVRAVGKEPIFCIDETTVDVVKHVKALTKWSDKVIEKAEKARFDPIEEYRWADEEAQQGHARKSTSNTGDGHSDSGCSSNVSHMHKSTSNTGDGDSGGSNVVAKNRNEIYRLFK
ncbi:hypothetical protein ACE6H2_026715 [Prunus campanulata]